MILNQKHSFLQNHVLEGEIDFFEIESQNLANVFGDPLRRLCPVYLPPGYKGLKGSQGHKTYPLLVDLAPFTGSGLGRVSWRNFGLNIPKRLERLILTKKIPPVVVAFPDCFTSLGGSQFVNSPLLGNTSDFLCHDLVPALEKKYGCGGVGQRVLYGKSSGGYGALYNVMHHPNFWSAVACHSGDIGFELAFLPDMALASMTLAEFEGSITAFLNAFWKSEAPKGAWIMTIMLLAMAASYDPGNKEDADFGLRLPVDLKTLEVHKERFEAWLRFDPLYWDAAQLKAFKGLKAFFIDCGRQDPYRLQFGARRFHQHLKGFGIRHIFQEFEGTHSMIDDRLEESLPLLLKAF